MVAETRCGESERFFVKACHEAWRARLGQLFESECQRLNLPRGSLPEDAGRRLVQRERDRFRAAVTRCKNAATIRETITDFWARSGSLPTLRQHWDAVLPLFDEEHWQVARDLALLALASYASERTEDEEQPKDSNTGTPGAKKSL